MEGATGFKRNSLMEPFVIAVSVLIAVARAKFYDNTNIH